jgi:hypothetical protein
MTMARDRKDSEGHKGSSRSLLRPIALYFLLAYGGIVITVGGFLWFSAAIPMLVLIRRKAWRWVAIGLLLNPMVFYFAGTCVAYSTGTAYFKRSGLPAPKFHNLDPFVRCFRRTSGCLIDGGEFIEQAPNHLALKLMGALFGPMPGSYHGEYPTSQEAILAIRSAGPLSIETLKSNRIPLPDGSATVHLAKELGADLVAGSRMLYFDPIEEGGPPSPRMARIGQCLLIGIPRVKREYHFSDKPPDENDIDWVITLFDIETGEAFAWYSTGEFPSRCPMFYRRRQIGKL